MILNKQENIYIIGKIAGYLLLFFLPLVLLTCEKERPVIPSGKTDKIIIDSSKVDSISYKVAKVSCTIEKFTNKKIGQHGFCWNNNGNPSLEDAKVELGNLDQTSFQYTFRELIPGTVYYVKPYLISGVNIIYGPQITFTTTPLGYPVLITNPLTDSTACSVVSGGIVTDDGGSEIIARGVCWGTVPSPIISEDTTQNGSGLGSFISQITNLRPNTKYFIRAYAINDLGISYGNELSFSTFDGIIEIYTSEILNIYVDSATSGGLISRDGGSSITARGVCWNTTGYPTVSDYKSFDGIGTGSFTSQITGLEIGTKYYVRAYASNEVDTAYGSERSFTTKDGIPVLTTTQVSNIKPASAISGGNISDDGGFPITSRGVCWNTIGSPTINDNKTTDGDGTGSYTSELTGLSGDTEYYVRAYASNNYSTAYGNELSFSITSTGTVADREGNIYNWVIIGEQIWLTENIRSISYSDGTPIPILTDWLDWIFPDPFGNERAYCWYNNNEGAYKDTYGALYNRYAALNGYNTSNANPSGIQGVCPTGWHIPSDEEWKQLEIYLGMDQSVVDSTGWRGADEGSKLKSINGWNSGGNGTNISGFSALPGGYRDASDGAFNGVGVIAYYWSSTVETSGVCIRGLDSFEGRMYRNFADKFYGIGVRCIKD